MDYNKVKLGLIGRFKVWNQRRIAEEQRDQYYKDEGELLEVDYSEADKLQADLLEQKRMKKATRDAMRLYKKVYGKNNDGIGETDFIEDYLVENGLKQKALPEPETSKKHNFMEQYPTEKSEEELAYEQAIQKKTMYYEIDGVKYELPIMFSQKYFEQMKSGDVDLDIPLRTNDGINYIIAVQGMKPENKYDMLKRMTDLSLSQISEEAYMIAQANPDTELQDTVPLLCRQSSHVDYAAKKLYSDGKIEEANGKLEQMVEKVLKLYQDMSKSEQEAERE